MADSIFVYTVRCETVVVFELWPHLSVQDISQRLDDGSTFEGQAVVIDYIACDPTKIRLDLTVQKETSGLPDVQGAYLDIEAVVVSMGFGYQNLDVLLY